MKSLLFFLMLSTSAYAQIDTFKVYKYSIEIENLNRQEFDDSCNLLTECDLFGFSYFCNKENLFITEAYLDLTKLEFLSLFETVVDKNRVTIKPIDSDEEFHCDTSAESIIIKD